jgi:hypothetical protein
VLHGACRSAPDNRDLVRGLQRSPPAQINRPSHPNELAQYQNPSSSIRSTEDSDTKWGDVRGDNIKTPQVFGTKFNVFWAIAAFLVLAALSIRVPYVIHTGIWRDEASTWMFASMPLRTMIERVAEYDSNPPLFYIIEWCWVRIVGNAMSLHTVSIALSGALVFVAFLLGRMVASARVGLIAALFAVTNPWAFLESLDARAYILGAVMVCAFAVSLEAYLRSPRLPNFFLAAVILTCAGYSQYASGLACGALILAYLVLSDSNRSRTNILGVVVLAGVLYIPWFKGAIHQYQAGFPIGSSSDAGTVVWNILVKLLGVVSIPIGASPVVFVLLDGLIVIAVSLCVAFSAGARRHLLLNYGVAIMAFFAVESLLHWPGQRYAFAIYPLGWVLMAIAIEMGATRCLASRGKVARFAYLSGVAVLAVVMMTSAKTSVAWASQPKSGMASAWEALRIAPRGPTIVAPDYLAPSFVYYSEGKHPFIGFARRDRPELQRFGADYVKLWRDPALISRFIESLPKPSLRGDGRLYVVEAADTRDLGVLRFSRTHEMLAKLKARYRLVGVSHFDGWLEPVDLFTFAV